jgi:hypothetical protein
VGLIAREIEARGIPTVVVASVRRAIGLTHPPRTLMTGRANSEVIGAPGDGAAQRETLRGALSVLTSATTPGVVEELPRSW